MRFLVTTLLGALLAGGCAQALPGASATPSGNQPTTPTSAPPSATPAVIQPTSAAEPTTQPTTEPTLVASDSPPGATLTAVDEAVVGWLGTYCWQGLCADVFEQPPAESLPLLQITDAQALTFTLASEPGFVSWNASYGDGSPDMTPLGQGGADYDPDTNATLPALLGTAQFDSPPPGDWVVIVQAFFAEGDAQYGWHVVVE